LADSTEANLDVGRWILEIDETSMLDFLSIMKKGVGRISRLSREISKKGIAIVASWLVLVCGERLGVCLKIILAGKTITYGF
jgi:hypothetical protein